MVPCEFIGIVRSQQSVYLKGEVVSNHDELMCNFFAQVRGPGTQLGVWGAGGKGLPRRAAVPPEPAGGA